MRGLGRLQGCLTDHRGQAPQAVLVDEAGRAPLHALYGAVLADGIRYDDVGDIRQPQQG